MKAWKDFSITIAGVCLVGVAIYLAVTWFGRKQPVNQIASTTFPDIQSNVWMVEQGIVMKTNLLKCPHCGQWMIKP